ncbi:hypothetical protein OAO01_03165 [Oligoflexia bacterium]|nr:hypothetical protein [Oligoflexia bacterium]
MKEEKGKNGSASELMRLWEEDATPEERDYFLQQVELMGSVPDPSRLNRSMHALLEKCEEQSRGFHFGLPRLFPARPAFAVALLVLISVVLWQVDYAPRPVSPVHQKGGSILISLVEDDFDTFDVFDEDILQLKELT